MSDLFEQLLPCAWRDVQFPVTQIEVTLAHDLVEHKYWGVDGAKVEDTGLAPMRFSVSIPFINGIVPGKGEKWGALYPIVMRAFFKAFADKTTGFFQHPEFGQIPCKPEHMKLTLSGDHRGGMTCEASFVETLPEGVDANLLDDTRAENIELAATDLDASDADLHRRILRRHGKGYPRHRRYRHHPRDDDCWQDQQRYLPRRAGRGIHRPR